MSARALALATLVALAAAAPARGDDGGAHRHWLWPDQGKVQLAGTIGFLSAGGGWDFAGERLELDLLAGWVPARYTGDDLFTFTSKLTWLPWRVAVGRGWHLRPLTAALAVTYTAGDQFWVILPDYYPSGYYELPSALRGSLALGGTLGRPVGGLKELAVYWEVVATDIPLGQYVTNRAAVDATDVFSMAFGLRVER